MSQIIWTLTDEAPALATYSLLPIVKVFTQVAGIEVVTSDISLSSRVLAAMGCAEDELSKLSEVVQEDDTIIIKLPNISASVSQLKDCIAELQAQGHKIPEYPETPASAEEEAIEAKYATCLGSTVNPLLRAGSSDRCAVKTVKKLTQNNLDSFKAADDTSLAYAAHISGEDDFFSYERSVTLDVNPKSSISVTDEILDDQVTATKMLSIIPLMAGGFLYEAGESGSAPKHVEQFLTEGHLRWDSLGEFLALAESLRFLAQKHSDDKLTALTVALDVVNEAYLDNHKKPGTKVGQPDTRASHFFFAQYWAKALAESDNIEVSEKYLPLASALIRNEEKIMGEILATESYPKDIGGYFRPDSVKVEQEMRPSTIFNAIIDAI